MTSDPPYYARSGFYLRLSTCPLQERCFRLPWQPLLLSFLCPRTFSLPPPGVFNRSHAYRLLCLATPAAMLVDSGY